MMHLSTCKGGAACCCPDEHEHVWEFGSYACVTCGELNQMTFDEVIEYELQPGDPDYTTWLREDRPRLSWDEYDALRKKKAPYKPIEDVLPGL